MARQMARQLTVRFEYEVPAQVDRTHGLLAIRHKHMKAAVQRASRAFTKALQDEGLPIDEGKVRMAYDKPLVRHKFTTRVRHLVNLKQAE